MNKILSKNHRQISRRNARSTLIISTESTAIDLHVDNGPPEIHCSLRIQRTFNTHTMVVTSFEERLSFLDFSISRERHERCFSTCQLVKLFIKMTLHFWLIKKSSWPYSCANSQEARWLLALSKVLYLTSKMTQEKNQITYSHYRQKFSNFQGRVYTGAVNRHQSSTAIDSAE